MDNHELIPIGVPVVAGVARIGGDFQDLLADTSTLLMVLSEPGIGSTTKSPRA